MSEKEEFTFNLELNTKFEVRAEDESDAWEKAEDFSSDLVTEIEKATGIDFSSEWTME